MSQKASQDRQRDEEEDTSIKKFEMKRGDRRGESAKNSSQKSRGSSQHDEERKRESSQGAQSQGEGEARGRGTSETKSKGRTTPSRLRGDTETKGQQEETISTKKASGSQPRVRSQTPKKTAKVGGKRQRTDDEFYRELESRCKIGKNSVPGGTRDIFDFGELCPTERSRISRHFAHVDAKRIKKVGEKDPEILKEYGGNQEIMIDEIYNPKYQDHLLKESREVILITDLETGKRHIALAEDLDLQEEDEFTANLRESLQELRERHGKTEEEITDLFLMATGDILRLKNHLEGKKVIMWTYLEDLALNKGDDSDELKFLAKQKGMGEIEKRRRFLKIAMD